MSDFITGALITGGLGFGASLLNNLFASDGIDYEEMAHLMDVQNNYSKDLMGYQDMLNNFNTIREREYSTPLNQVERLRAAGLNPVGRNLDGTSASTPAVGIASSPNSSEAYAAVKNAKMQEKQYGLQLMNLAAQTAKTIAETKNIQENTKKTGAETEGLQIDNKYKAGKYELELKLGDWQIKGAIDAHNISVKQQKLIDTQTANIAKQTESLEQQVKESVARVGKINSEKEFQDLVNKFYPAKTRAEIAEMASRQHVNEATAKQMETMLPYMVTKACIENGLLAFDFEKSSVIRGYTNYWQSYGETEASKLDTEHMENKVREKQAELDFGYLSTYGDYKTVAKFIESSIGALGTPLKWLLK